MARQWSVHLTPHEVAGSGEQGLGRLFSVPRAYSSKERWHKSRPQPGWQGGLPSRLQIPLDLLASLHTTISQCPKLHGNCELLGPEHRSLGVQTPKMQLLARAAYGQLPGLSSPMQPGWLQPNGFDLAVVW